jgi:hypothetical protein
VCVASTPPPRPPRPPSALPLTLPLRLLLFTLLFVLFSRSSKSHVAVSVLDEWSLSYYHGRNQYEVLSTNSAAIGPAWFLPPARQAGLVRRHLSDAWKAVARFNSAVVWPNFMTDLAFTWWLRTFIGWFVIGPHIKTGAAAKAPDTLEAIAKLRGDIGHQFVLFVQSMIAAGLTGACVRVSLRVCVRARVLAPPKRVWRTFASKKGIRGALRGSPLWLH